MGWFIAGGIVGGGIVACLVIGKVISFFLETWDEHE